MGAAVMLAIADITRKRILFKSPSQDFLTVFTLCSAGFALLLFPFVTFSLPPLIYGLIVLIACIAATAYYFKFKTIKHFELSTFLPLTNIQPLIILFLGVLFLNETVHAIQVIGIALILVGGYALELNSHLKLLHPLKMLRQSKYQRYMVAAILLVAAVMFVEKYTLNQLTALEIPYPHLTLAFFVWPVIALLTTVHFTRHHSVSRAFHRIYNREGFFMFIPPLAIVLFFITYYKALSLYYITLVLPLVKLNTLFSAILGGKLFHEKHLLMKSIACMIMIIGTFFIVQ